MFCDSPNPGFTPRAINISSLRDLERETGPPNLTTAVGGASRFSLSREGKKRFVIHLTLGLHQCRIISSLRDLEENRGHRI